MNQEQIVEALSNLSVMDLCNLTRELESKWGVTAAPIAVPRSQEAPPTLPVNVEAQTEFTVILTAAGDKKIEVIKLVRSTLGLGLKEAKDMVEGGLPKPIKEAISKADADDLKRQFEAAGAKVELK